MGGCCSSQPPDLPEATNDDLNRLREKGYLPCLAGPSVDFDGQNQCQCVYIAEYENGAEITFLFLDEDRPNMCEDCVYDHIRRPLFGRWEDIESVVIINDEMEFPGTHSGDQKWKCKVPEHGHATIKLSEFEKNDTDPIVWVNTWNHLVGEKNNNTDMEITYQKAMRADEWTPEKKDFVIRLGSRAEVDSRYKGLMTTLSTIITPERAGKLGKRVNVAVQSNTTTQEK